MLFSSSPSSLSGHALFHFGDLFSISRPSSPSFHISTKRCRSKKKSSRDFGPFPDSEQKSPSVNTARRKERKIAVAGNFRGIISRCNHHRRRVRERYWQSHCCLLLAVDRRSIGSEWTRRTRKSRTFFFEAPAELIDSRALSQKVRFLFCVMSWPFCVCRSLSSIP